jgi:4-hydroxybenzoate polyprenyl transferase
MRLARLNKPTGIWLLFLPCLFGIFFSVKKLPNSETYEVIKIISLFLAGSIIMRSAGCVINDLLDQKFDEKVDRTKSRPLAAKTVSRRNAVMFLGILLFLGLLILIQFNLATIISGFLALALVATYPLMKRITYYPQVFLGITFNFGILMSCLAMKQNISVSVIALYFGTIIWTVIYDTIYAYQDIDDDLQIGVKSTAIKFQKNPRKILTILNFLLFLTFAFVGWKESFGSGYFLAILVADLFLNQKIQNCDFDNPQKCLKNFKANIWVGILILTAIILG